MDRERPDALDPLVEVEPEDGPAIGADVPEADAVEQAQSLGEPDEPESAATVAFDLDPADAAEQRRSIGGDDDERR